MSTKKKPASSKEELAKGAEKIRKLAAKSEPKKPAAKKKAPAENGALTVLPLVKESTEEIQSLLKKHIVFAEDFTSLRIKDDVELGEYLPMYDYIKSESANAKDRADKWQFIEGDFFNEGKRLFGNEFAVLMATNGRPVSTLRKLGSIATNIDTAIRNLHPRLTWSHVAEVAKVPKEADKLAILETAAKKFDAGENVSVKDIRAEADKHKPKKVRKKKGKPVAEKYEMLPDESAMYDEFSDKAEDLRTFALENKKQLKALFPKLTGNDKKAVLESLDLVAELYALLA